MSGDVAQKAHATSSVPIPDITFSARTSQHNSPSSVDHHTHSSTPITNTPARSVLQDMLPATTLAGKTRQRMKWTYQINRELLRCYYIVTLCETDLTAYRPLLHQKFKETFPELSHISEQRLADQIRVIHRNNRIPEPERERIKQSVSLINPLINLSNSHNNDDNTEHQYTMNNSTNDDQQPYSNSLTHTPTSQQTLIHQTNTTTQTSQPQEISGYTQTHGDDNRSVNPEEYSKIENTFKEMLIKYTDTDPTLRPTIPKLQTTRKTIKTVNTLNEIIDLHLQTKETMTIKEIHEIIYCAALTVTTIHTQKAKQTDNNTTHTTSRTIGQKKPQWETRIENKITALRKEIGQLTQYLNGNLTQKKRQKLNPNNRTDDEITDQLDTNKQKLQAYSKRLRRYKKSNQRKRDNKLFYTNQKLFYQNLNSEHIQITQPPDITNIQRYWETLWSNPIQHETHSSWAEIEEQEVSNLETMPDITIDNDDVTQAIKKTLNWKAPGPDKIQNYWIKYFSATHKHIATALNHLIKNPQDMPLFLTQGITYLKPKDNDTTNPAKYRPITCLPTIYKLLTSIISQKLNSHITQNKIIPEEQKGCSKGSRGCKEQLVIDTEIHNQVKQQHRNLFYSYIDYQKAFDSVPHSWLIHVLKIYKVDNSLIQFLQYAMNNWTTKLNLRTNNATLSTPPIKIARGIFQGDSLSPLWFCLALNPLSRILNKTGYGYTIDRENDIKLTHLLYMDDIKLYATNRQQLEHLLKITENFSTDIKMTFGTDKCKVNSIIKGQHKETDPFNLELQGGTIDSMELKETYKYLGYHQTTSINHTDIKNTLKTKYKQRLNKILSTQLSARNKIKAINTYAIPILTYSFGVIKWSDTELETLNTATRTASNKHNIHHIHSAVQRFTLKRKLGGRGLIDIKNLHYTQIDNLRTYFLTKANESTLHKAIANLPRPGTPLQLNNSQYNPKLKILSDEQKLENWKGKALHGKYPHQLEQDHIDRTASCTWLTKGNIFGETEGFLIAIQDQVIKTRNYSKYILKESLETDKCRLCHQTTETIDHVTGGCSVLANKEYTHRHDNVAKHIHQQLALKHKLLDTNTAYYKYKPKNVLENDNAKLYWNRDIITDRTILSNRPDITLTIKSTKTTYLIDISVPNTHNLKQKHTEKIQKYIPLADEIKQMWHQETVRIIPIIISSTGVIPKTLKAALKILELHENTYIPLQKSIVIDTCSMVRRFLNPTSLILQNNTSQLTHTTHNTQIHTRDPQDTQITLHSHDTNTPEPGYLA